MLALQRPLTAQELRDPALTWGMLPSDLASLQAEADAELEPWRRIVRGLRRRSFLRRLWAALGHFLDQHGGSSWIEEYAE